MPGVTGPWAMGPNEYDEYHEQIRTCRKHHRKFVGDECPVCEQDIDRDDWHDPMEDDHAAD